MSIDPLSSQLSQRQLFASGYDENPYSNLNTGSFRATYADMFGFHMRRLDMTLSRQRELGREARVRTAENITGSIYNTGSYLSSAVGLFGGLGLSAAGMAALPAGAIAGVAGLAGNYFFDNSARRHRLSQTIRREFQGAYGERILGVSNMSKGAGLFSSGSGASKAADVFSRIASKDQDFSAEDLVEIASRFSRKGMLDNSKSLRDFEKNFKVMKDDLKELMQVMGTGIEEATSLMQEFSRSGVPQSRSAAIRLAKISADTSRRTGISTAAAMHAGMMGKNFAAMHGFGMSEFSGYSAFRKGQIVQGLNAQSFNELLPGAKQRIRMKTGMDPDEAIQAAEQKILSTSVLDLLALGAKEGGGTPEEIIKNAMGMVRSGKITAESLVNARRGIRDGKTVRNINEARRLLKKTDLSSLSRFFSGDKFLGAAAGRLGATVDQVASNYFGVDIDVLRALREVSGLRKDVFQEKDITLDASELEELGLGGLAESERLRLRNESAGGTVKTARTAFKRNVFEGSQRLLQGDGRKFLRSAPEQRVAHLERKIREALGGGIIKKNGLVMSLGIFGYDNSFNLEGSGRKAASFEEEIRSQSYLQDAFKSRLAGEKKGQREALREYFASMGLSEEEIDNRVGRAMKMDDKDFFKGMSQSASAFILRKRSKLGLGAVSQGSMKGLLSVQGGNEQALKDYFTSLGTITSNLKDGVSAPERVGIVAKIEQSVMQSAVAKGLEQFWDKISDDFKKNFSSQDRERTIPTNNLAGNFATRNM